MKNYIINTLIFFTLALTATVCHAEEYDALLLRMQASIYPKIAMLDKKIQNKRVNDDIIFVIAHAKNELQYANNLKKLINDEYKGKIGEHQLIVNTSEFMKLDNSTPATAFIFLKGSRKMHAYVTDIASRNNRISFSYDHNDLKNNSLISLLIKEKAYIYLNKPVMSEYQIDFLPLFYKIVTVQE